MEYDDTIIETSKEKRGALERISLWIPGYRGYRLKNIRRDVDREIRSYVVRAMNMCKTDLVDIQRRLTDNGDIASAKSVERLRVKTDTFIKSIESAEVGYSGIWETTKTLESELESVMEWDAKLLESADALKKLLEKILRMLETGDTGIKNELSNIDGYLNNLVSDLTFRMQTLRGLSAHGMKRGHD